MRVCIASIGVWFGSLDSPLVRALVRVFVWLVWLDVSRGFIWFDKFVCMFCDPHLVLVCSKHFDQVIRLFFGLFAWRLKIYFEERIGLKAEAGISPGGNL